MYHSNPLYTRDTGLSNCILGMSNLTADIHMHKIFIFEIYLLVQTLWQLCETSEIRVVRGELGANSTSLHA